MILSTLLVTISGALIGVTMTLIIGGLLYTTIYEMIKGRNTDQLGLVILVFPVFLFIIAAWLRVFGL